MAQTEARQQFVICTQDQDCDDLDRRKIYQVIPDQTAAAEGYVRVIDESGEDYLYPSRYFMPIELPQDVEEALRLVS